MDPKARCDSKLKTLPEERQDQIAEWCRAAKTETCAGGIAYALEQLASDGIKVSRRAVSEFFSWYRLREDFSGAESFATSVENALKKEFPDATPEKLAAAGQLAFTAMATRQHDPEEFREMQYLRLAEETARTKARNEDRKIKLAERRVSLMERKLEAVKGTVSDEKLSPEERQARLKQIFGLS